MKKIDWPSVKIVKGVIFIRIPVIHAWAALIGLGLAFLISACQSATWV